MIDRPTDRPTHRPTHRSNRRHGSEVADIQAPHLRRRTGLGLTALIGDLVLISSRPGQPAGRRAPASRFCFFRPDYCRCIGCTPSMGPCSHRYICRRIPIASEPYSLVKPAGANRPPAPSALWRCGARLAGVFPRAGKGKHGGATTGRSYNGPPCARETPLARSLSQLHCAGLYVRGCGPTFASSPVLPDRQTSDVESNLDPRPSTLKLSSPLSSRSVQPAMAPNPAAIVGLARPPPGVTPNFAHPESRGYRISITLIVCLVLCTGVVLLRLYTRYFITRMIGVDDYMIIAAMLLSVGYVVTVFELNIYGVGMHMWDIPLTNSPLILKWSLTQGVFFNLSILFAKLSILQFYLRLSPHLYFRITVHALSVTITLYSLVVAFQFLFACQPIAKYWDYTIKYGTCINSVKIWIFNSVVNSVTDLAMIFLPILMMWNVQIARRQKIAVNCIFLLGGFVTIVSVIRLYYIVQYLHVTYDSTWNSVPSAVWAVIELFVAIICACLPHTKPFFMRHFPKLLRSSTSPPFSTAHPYSNTQRYSNSQAFSRGIRSETNDEDTLDTHKDISLRVLVTGGKTATTSIADTESQKAILGDDGIFVRSEVHVGEESARRDIP